jgi:hypothetical protein
MGLGLTNLGLAFICIVVMVTTLNFLYTPMYQCKEDGMFSVTQKNTIQSPNLGPGALCDFEDQKLCIIFNNAGVTIQNDSI